MKYLLPLVLILSIVVLSCDKDKNDEVVVCDVENPLEELEWLLEVASSLENCSCKQTIFQGRFQNSIVFFITMNDPLCDGIFSTVLLNCEGDIVKEYDSDDYDSFAQEVEIIEEIYTCKE